jgi:surface polysaccharide O-acyltransferase-like enzyme
MNKYLSVKLKVISFILMILVVLIHSQNIGTTLLAGNIVLEHGYSFYFQNIISNGICLIAVPLFFCISGYLFFLKFEGSYTEFNSKITKRVRTLVVPYLLWSIGVLLFIFILQLLPVSKYIFESKFIKDYSTIELFNKIFISPIPLQFWFVRDLIVLTFISPFIYWLIKGLKLFSILILLITWFLDFDFIFLANTSLLFFFIGAYLSIKKETILQNDFSKRYWFYTGLWLVLIFIKVTLLYINFQDQIILTVLNKSSILIGIIAIWSLYDFLFKNKDLSVSKYYGVFSFSFFIYAFHIPSLSFLKKGIFYLLGKSELVSLFNYITAPIIIIFLSIIIGYYLRYYIPAFYRIITGGR